MTTLALAIYTAVVVVVLGCALHVARKCDIDARAERARCERDSEFSVVPPAWFRSSEHEGGKP